MAPTWSITVLCQRVATALERLAERWLTAQCDVSLAQAQVLWKLDEMGMPVNQQQLADELQRSKGNVTGMLQRLEAKGYVVRTSHEEDARQLMVRLTPSGRDAAKRAREVLQLVENALAETAAGQTREVMDGLSLLELALARLATWTPPAAQEMAAANQTNFTSQATAGSQGPEPVFLPIGPGYYEPRSRQTIVYGTPREDRPVALDQQSAVLPHATWEAAREAVLRRERTWTGEQGTLHSRLERERQREQGGASRTGEGKPIDVKLHRPPAKKRRSR